VINLTYFIINFPYQSGFQLVRTLRIARLTLSGCLLMIAEKYIDIDNETFKNSFSDVLNLS